MTTDMMTNTDSLLAGHVNAHAEAIDAGSTATIDAAIAIGRIAAVLAETKGERSDAAVLPHLKRPETAGRVKKCKNAYAAALAFKARAERDGWSPETGRMVYSAASRKSRAVSEKIAKIIAASPNEDAARRAIRDLDARGSKDRPEKSDAQKILDLIARGNLSASEANAIREALGSVTPLAIAA